MTTGIFMRILCVTEVQSYGGLLEKSVIHISELSNLRGRGAFIHQLPFIAGLRMAS